MKSKKRINIDPMRIAWLLRADLRQGAPADAPMSDWFKMWWLIHGPREYPAWANEATLRNAGLFRPQTEHPSFNGFGMTPALRFLLDTRKDLTSAFNIDTDDGLLRAIAWLFVHGIREHQLSLAIDEQTLDDLDAIPIQFANVKEDNDNSTEINWLMFFVWIAISDLQRKYNLNHENGRREYLHWFLFYGVSQLQLKPLLAQRWREWLRAPVLGTEATVRLPRATYLLWQHHEQLQRAFNLQTEKGLHGLSLWSAEVWKTQRELAWIDQDISLPRRNTRPKDGRPFGLNLIGFAFGELGIGEDVRMAVAACEAASIPFAVININPGDAARQADRILFNHVADTAEQVDPAPYAFNLFCLTAFDTSRVFLERGNELFSGRYNIGWWPWELPVWPKNWNCVFDLVDEVWAATQFTYTMYLDAAARSLSTSPSVSLMPMPATIDRLTHVTRETLGIPEEKFLFLYVFDFNSYLARKNPFATVLAFRHAFDEKDDSVGLVLKTMNADPFDPKWNEFIQECAKDARITIIDKTLERGEVLGLIEACDAYISLHRSEGFGRTLAEAMLLGKPVIATNFSGNVDFLTDKTGFPVEWRRVAVSPGDYPYVTTDDFAWWADPLAESAATNMVAAKNQNLSTEYLTKFARKKFSPQQIGHSIKNKLLDIFLI